MFGTVFTFIQPWSSQTLISNCNVLLFIFRVKQTEFWSTSHYTSLSAWRNCKGYVLSRPLALRAAYSDVRIMGFILGVKIVYKHAQMRVDTQNDAHCSEARSVLCKKSEIETLQVGGGQVGWDFYAQRTAIVQWSASFLIPWRHTQWVYLFKLRTLW